MLLLIMIINFVFYYIIQIITNSNITFFFLIEALLTLSIFMGKYKCVLNI